MNAWAWRSTRPGATYAPDTSTTSRALSRGIAVSIAATRPDANAKSRRASAPEAGSITWPPVSRRSWRIPVSPVTTLEVAQHVAQHEHRCAEAQADVKAGAAARRLAECVREHRRRQDHDAADRDARPGLVRLSDARPPARHSGGDSTRQNRGSSCHVQSRDRDRARAVP